MAINDIVSSSGDAQGFVVEIPAGNASYVPSDTIIEEGGSLICSEIPEQTGGGNIFIMSE